MEAAAAAVRTGIQLAAAAAAAAVVVLEVKVYHTGADMIPTERAEKTKTLQSRMNNRRCRVIGMVEVGTNSGAGAEADAASKTVAGPARNVMMAFGRTKAVATVSKTPDTEPVEEVAEIAEIAEGGGGAAEEAGWKRNEKMERNRLSC